MLISMTGYGNGTATRDGITANAELRSVNSRYYEFSARLPKHLQVKENELKDLIRTTIVRGKINLNVSFEKSTTDGIVPIRVNETVAKAYHSLLSDLSQSVGLKDQIGIDTLLKFSDIFMVEESNDVSDAEWEVVSSAVQSAIAMLTGMRIKEGEELTNDLRGRLCIMDDAITSIESLSIGRPRQERERLHQRIEQVLSSDKIDNDRLELEIVLLADKMDITEELVRFRSHVKFFTEALEAPESEGRKLSFLLQEMNREANTIGSKASDADIAHLVVSIKEELERIREQIQNVE